MDLFLTLGLPELVAELGEDFDVSTLIPSEAATQPQLGSNSEAGPVDSDSYQRAYFLLVILSIVVRHTSSLNIGL
ncbi:hypothetical protein D9611_000643 [Ephemerocybe angulata]|uniref:Uncharacterized protein n=1 Tax=Ephemerocybe angulata TaxID=980116 RepID=A0A8H5F6W4_9AGAR|nr:hypothetical protein D9611_000643 [Tulosesus angulatus]